MLGDLFTNYAPLTIPATAMTTSTNKQQQQQQHHHQQQHQQQQQQPMNRKNNSGIDESIHTLINMADEMEPLLPLQQEVNLTNNTNTPTTTTTTNTTNCSSAAASDLFTTLDTKPLALPLPIAFMQVNDSVSYVTTTDSPTDKPIHQLINTSAPISMAPQLTSADHNDNLACIMPSLDLNSINNHPQHQHYPKLIHTATSPPVAIHPNRDINPIGSSAQHHNQLVQQQQYYQPQQLPLHLPSTPMMIHQHEMTPIASSSTTPQYRYQQQQAQQQAQQQQLQDIMPVASSSNNPHHFQQQTQQQFNLQNHSSATSSPNGTSISHGHGHGHGHSHVHNAHRHQNTNNSRRPGTGTGNTNKNNGKKSGNAVRKKTQRKPKTYSKPIPSRFCHICSRMPRRGQGSATCKKILEGLCRKIVCEQCIIDQGWDFKQIKEDKHWECPHCAENCPPRSQCHIYNRINARRKKAEKAEDDENGDSGQNNNDEIQPTQTQAQEHLILENRHLHGNHHHHQHIMHGQHHLLPNNIQQVHPQQQQLQQLQQQQQQSAVLLEPPPNFRLNLSMPPYPNNQSQF